MTPSRLTDLGFLLYYEYRNYEIGSGESTVKDGMQPPKNAKLIFMGCGQTGQPLRGIIATPDQIFDQKGHSLIF